MTKFYFRHGLRAILLGLVITAPGWLVPLKALGNTTQSDSEQNYDIATGSLDQVLNRFAVEAGIEISIDASLTANKQSNGLQGRYSIDEGLTMLLETHDLRAVRAGSGAYILEAMPADVAGDTRLDDVTVIGTASQRRAVGLGPGRPDAVVTAASIERLQANDLEDVFRQEPEVAVGGSLGIAQKVYVRGIEDTLLNVSIDGATQSGRLFHHTGRLSIEPELLKRVEVQAGTGSATAGPGALGGAIRFITKDPEDLLRPDEDLGGLVKFGYFSNTDGYKANTSLFGRLNDQWSAMVSLSHMDHERIEDGDGNELVGTDSEQQLGFAKIVGHLTDSQTLRLSYDRRTDDGERTQRPQWIVSSFNPVYPLELERETVTLNYALNPLHNEFLNLETTVYHTNAQVEQDVFDRWGIYRGESESNGFDIHNTSRLGMHELTYGMDYRRDTAIAGGAADPDEQEEKSRVTGFYLQDDIHLTEALLLSAGLRHDTYKLDDNSDQEFEEDGFSPSVGLTYQFTPTFSAYASYAEAIRGPLSLDTFKLEGFIKDPALQAEEADNTEIGFAYYGDRLFFSGKVYRTRIENVIADPVGGPRLYQNIGDLKSEGYLLQAGLAWHRLQSSISFHHNDAEVDGQPLNAYDHSGVGNTIGYTWVTDLSYRVNRGLEFGWVGRFVHGVNNIETSVGHIDKPGYGVHDLYAYWQPTGSERLRLTLTLKNLFDKRYLDHASNASFEHFPGYQGIVGLPEAGRDIRIGLAWRF